MRKRIAVVAIAAIASLALLVPAGSASADGYHYCQSTYGFPVTLSPGQDCRGFGPLKLFRVVGVWEVVKPGNGVVCVGITKLNTRTPLNDFNQPSGWNQTGDECTNVNASSKVAVRYVVGGFGAVPGQPMMLNYSTATIRSVPAYSLAWYYP